MIDLLENGVEVNANHVFEFVLEDPRSMGLIQFVFQDRLGICQELAIQVIRYDVGQVLHILDGEGSTRGSDPTDAWVEDVDGYSLTECQLVVQNWDLAVLTSALDPAYR
jgi:hypothetical protein